MKTIFHIALIEDWQKAFTQGCYEPESLETEGFIHFSTPQQVLATAERYFTGESGLVLLAVDEDEVSTSVEHEGDDELFPHLYRSLPLDAVVDGLRFQETDQGFELPAPYVLQGECLIRPARPSDSGEVANVHISSWREAYTGILPDNVIDNLPLQFRRRQRWWKDCALKYEETRPVVVAESSDHGIVGFASVEAARNPQFQGYGELTSIYLLSSYKGQGIGRALLDQAFLNLKQMGFDKAYCWVLQDNPTLDFYLKSGGKLPGITTTLVIGHKVEEVAVVWEEI